MPHTKTPIFCDLLFYLQPPVWNALQHERRDDGPLNGGEVHGPRLSWTFANGTALDPRAEVAYVLKRTGTTVYATLAKRREILWH